MSVYHHLLRIKQFRESQAETEVRRRRVLLAEAKAKAEELQRKLEEYRIWSAQHERDLYDDLCTRLVKLREIEDLQTTISELRNSERNMEQGVLEADQHRHSVAGELDQALDTLSLAGRQTNKFKELSRVYSEEARMEQERQEEMEMEEFRSPDGRDDEWESASDDDTTVH